MSKTMKLHVAAYSCVRKALPLLLWMLVTQVSHAQSAAQNFDLVAQDLGLKSEATLSANQLRIRGPKGVVTDYTRDSQYDTADQKWIGFSSRSANQVVRWPVSNRGSLQIGQPNGRTVAFQASSMQIQPTATNATMQSGSPGGLFSPSIPTSPIVNPATNQNMRSGGLLKNLAESRLFGAILRAGGQNLPVGQLLRLANLDPRGNPWVLAQGTGRTLVATQTSSSGLDWYVTPVGNGLVRVQTYQSGNVFAIGTNSVRSLGLVPSAQDPNQLWRVGSGRAGNQFFLESVAFPGSCLARTNTGLAIQPISFAQTQMWSPFTAPPVAGFRPFWRTVSTELVQSAPLPPAQLELVNSHRYALVIALGDVRRGVEFEQLRIQPGQSITVQLDRDSGATIVETVEYRTFGGWQQEKYVTAVPSAAYYDLSVYEEHLQSIAIDATGKSPNRIEDTNYVPKSVGWLPLPPGDAIPEQGSIDLYPKAKAAKNPGAVRILDAEQFNAKPKERPLEKLLNDFQKPQAKRRGF